MAMPDTASATTPSMRILLVIAGALVLTIGTPLFILPTETKTWFSWTVNPPLTAAFLGGAYWSAFLLEYLSSRERVWARARLAVPAVLSFTTLTLVVTLLHVDKFHFGSDVSVLTLGITWTWMIVYAVVPGVMAVVLVLQLRQRGMEPVRVSPLPAWVRIAFIGQAAVMLPLGVALLLMPTDVAPTAWPWALSALTGRAIGAWLVGMGIAAAHAAWENDLVRLEGAMFAYLAFGALELGALLRFATADHPITGDPVLDWSGARAWLYAAFLVSIAVVGLLGAVAARHAKRLEGKEPI